MKFTIALLIGAAAAKKSAPVQALADLEWQCYSDDASVDSFGDGCDWYDANPEGCGAYDSETFTASELCCACDGGWSAACYDEDNMDTLTDSGGDGCDWYNANPD